MGSRSANMAGPILRGGEVALAVIDALVEDNPEKNVQVQDHGSYVRVEAEGGMILRRETVEAMLGRPFRMQELEIWLTGFSGKIETTADYVKWYFKINDTLAAA